MTTQDPTLREVVEFKERYGLEAFFIYCICMIDQPREVLINLLRLGRHFGPLDDDRYQLSALSELMRMGAPTEVVEAIIAHSIAGNFIDLEAVHNSAIDCLERIAANAGATL